MHHTPKGLTGKPALVVRHDSSLSEFNDLKNFTSKLFFSVLMKLLNVIKCCAAVKNDALFTDLPYPKGQKGTGKLVMCLLNYL